MTREDLPDIPVLETYSYAEADFTEIDPAACYVVLLRDHEQLVDTLLLHIAELEAMIRADLDRGE